jgi:hypothetical protein
LDFYYSLFNSPKHGEYIPRENQGCVKVVGTPKSFCNKQFSLRMCISTISTSHKYYNNFSRINIENVLKFLGLLEGIYVGINISKVLNFKSNDWSTLFKYITSACNRYEMILLQRSGWSSNAPPGPEPLFPILKNPSSLYYYPQLVFRAFLDKVLRYLLSKVKCCD